MLLYYYVYEDKLKSLVVELILLILQLNIFIQAQASDYG